MDPWSITPTERMRHEEQFRSLGPAPNGMVTGSQARNFFLQSGLPPMVLAQIWGLADVNGDGQMDINEFSIACKLITCKLKGYEIPASLPPTLSMTMQMAAPQMPPGSLPIMGMTMQPQNMMMMPGQPGMMAPAAMMTAQGMAPMMTATGQMMPAAPMHMQMMGMGMPQMGAQAMPGMPGMPGVVMPHAHQMVAPIMTEAMPVVHSAVVSAAASEHASGTSTPVAMEWSVPQANRIKYGQQFNASEGSKTGFLAGIQARNLLLQSGLPGAVLAQVWALSDVDGDGRLTAEEYILAGHLCELALKGETLPAALPANLVPPSLRKASSAAPGAMTPKAEDGANKAVDNKKPEVISPAELERRRQSLAERQKKEEEEKKKKDLEDKKERERQRQEQERQRLADWEQRRKDELLKHRQNEEEKVFAIKARHEHISTELDALREKVSSLTEKIGDTRSGVTEIKSCIDGMRSSRDEKMQAMTSLKNQLKDQNQRLLQVAQEKAKLDAKNRANAAAIDEGQAQELSEYEAKKMIRQRSIDELKERMQKLKEKEDEVRQLYDKEKTIMNEHRDSLKTIIESCKVLYDEFDEKRREIKAEKAKRIRELTDPDHAWGAEKEALPEAVPAQVSFDESSIAVNGFRGPDSASILCRALFDFESDNPDELHFRAGDVITVHPGQANEPGWLGGELNGKMGWFPESYVEVIAEAAQDIPSAAAAVSRAKSLEVTQDMFVSIYAYASEEPGDLCFEAGTHIDVLKQDGEWWTGQIGDRVGTFPYNYVQPVEVTDTAGAVEERSAVKFQKQVSFSSKLSWNNSASHVTHQVGVAVCPEPCPVEEYNQDEHPQKSATTDPPLDDEAVAEAAETDVAEALPDASTIGRSKSKSRRKKDGDGKGGKKPELATVLANYTASSKEQLSLQKGQMILVRKKTDTGWWQGELQASKGKKRQVGWFPASYAKLMEASIKETSQESAPVAAAPEPESCTAEKYIALFPYEGQHEDELSFQANDIINLISQEEDSWWKGELNGQVGVFPSNYVERMG